MFDKLHFLSYVGDCDEKDIYGDAKYQILKDKYGMSDSQEQYHLQGRNLFLLSHPVTEEHRKYLMRLQSFSYMETGEKYYTRRKNYDSFLLLYTYEGQGRVSYRGKERAVKKNEGVLIDCREWHEYRADSEIWKQCCLHFTGGISELLFREFVSGTEPYFYCNNHKIFQQKLEQLLLTHESAGLKRDVLFSYQLEGMLLYVFDCMSQGKDEDGVPENLRLLRNYLEHNFTLDISLDEMAEFAGFSKYYLIRQFKKYTGATPKEYVLKLRIDQACLLLQSTDLPSYKIGQMAGFPSETNFIQRFKTYMGKTPGEYRREIVEVQ